MDNMENKLKDILSILGIPSNFDLSARNDCEIIK